MKTMVSKFSFLLALSAILGWGCTSRSNFTLGSLDEALATADSDGVETFDFVDSDGDGVADSIDTDGDGTGDIDFNPDTNPPGDDSGGDDGGDDPDLRSDSGNCIYDPLKTLGITSSTVITPAMMSGKDTVLISKQSSNGSITIDMSQLSTVKRVVIDISGNGNLVSVEDGDATVGYCNNMSGGSNGIDLDSDSSATKVDLETGTGNNNSMDVHFAPTNNNVVVSALGNNQCVAAPVDESDVTFTDNNGNDHTFHFNDSLFCL